MDAVSDPREKLIGEIVKLAQSIADKRGGDSPGCNCPLCELSRAVKRLKRLERN